MLKPLLPLLIVLCSVHAFASNEDGLDPLLEEKTLEELEARALLPTCAIRPNQAWVQQTIIELRNEYPEVPDFEYQGDGQFCPITFQGENLNQKYRGCFFIHSEEMYQLLIIDYDTGLSSHFGTFETKVLAATQAVKLHANWTCNFPMNFYLDEEK